MIPDGSEEAPWPNQLEDDFRIKEFRFGGGEVLPELNLHYRTIGSARRNGAGEINNAVLLIHNTGSPDAVWLDTNLYQSSLTQTH